MEFKCKDGIYLKTKAIALDECALKCNCSLCDSSVGAALYMRGLTRETQKRHCGLYFPLST